MGRLLYMYMSMKSKYLVFLVLIVIIIGASFLRLYKLTEVPPSISWDEAAVGYNAWTIGNYGKDEWGQSFPITFTSFKDDKHPVHVYITALFVKLLGPSDFSIRLPAAIFGILNVFLLFYLGNLLFKSKLLGLIAAFLLAVSPYAIQFSRFNHELSFTIFFFLLGLCLFYKGLEKKNYLIVLSYLSFGIDLLAYQSAEIVVPPLIFMISLLYFKDLWKTKRYFIAGLAIFLFVVVLILTNLKLLGVARASQTAFSKEQVQKTYLYKQTKNDLLGRANIVVNQYKDHFSPKFLFISGGENPRFSTQTIGEFYKIEALFLIIGLLVLVFKRSKVTLIILAWALLAPLPSSLAQESPHASRAMFMIFSNSKI
jgi:4-amino-4-deoxy-L-arabinose transferase-like glycosyltransferase